MSRRLWLVIFLCSGLGLGLYALRLAPALEDRLFMLYSTAAAAAIFLGIYLYRPQPLGAWLLIGAGQVFSALGDFAFTQAVYLQAPWQAATQTGWLYIAGQVGFLLGAAWLVYTYHRYITRYAV